MPTEVPHPSDQELVQAADGELTPDRAGQVNAHLSACWSCRARKHELEATIVDFVRLHRRQFDPVLPPADGPRALLKAHLAQMSAGRQPWWTRVLHLSESLDWRRAGAVMLITAAFAAGYRHVNPALSARSVPVFFPEPSLTPGAVATVSRDQICRPELPKNRAVPVSMQRRVFEEYGMPGAEPRSYEVDYLITPALGGAEDIRNLWPQSYSSAVWNARVKDALEDKLHDLVCDGTLAPEAAQRDISSDWIAAYKKYFHTEKPLDTNP
jgi:hypothetical protein